MTKIVAPPDAVATMTLDVGDTDQDHPMERIVNDTALLPRIAIGVPDTVIHIVPTVRATVRIDIRVLPMMTKRGAENEARGRNRIVTETRISTKTKAKSGKSHAKREKSRM